MLRLRDMPSPIHQACLGETLEDDGFHTLWIMIPQQRAMVMFGLVQGCHR